MAGLCQYFLSAPRTGVKMIINMAPPLTRRDTQKLIYAHPRVRQKYYNGLSPKKGRATLHVNYVSCVTVPK